MKETMTTFPFSIHAYNSWMELSKTGTGRVVLFACSPGFAACFDERSEHQRVLLPAVQRPNTEMKNEMEIVTDAIMLLLIEGEAKFSLP